MELKQALLKLDTTNDDHWTSDGLPRLDVLKEITGVPVQRKQISEICKTFSRANPLVEEAGSVESPAEKEQGETASPEGSSEVSVADTEAQATEDELVQVEFDKAQADLVAAKKRLDKASAAMDELITRRATAQRTKPADAIKAFQESQRKQREAAAKRAKEKGMDADTLRLAMHK